MQAAEAFGPSLLSVLTSQHLKNKAHAQAPQPGRGAPPALARVPPASPWGAAHPNTPPSHRPCLLPAPSVPTAICAQGGHRVCTEPADPRGETGRREVRVTDSASPPRPHFAIAAFHRFRLAGLFLFLSLDFHSGFRFTAKPNRKGSVSPTPASPPRTAARRHRLVPLVLPMP